MDTLDAPTSFSNQTNEFKDQVYISAMAWISIIFFGTVLFFTTIKLISSSLIFQLQASLFAEMEQINDPLFSEIETLLLISFSTIIIFSIALLLGSIGILNRKNWGRRLYSVSGVLAVLALIAAAIYYSYWHKQQMIDFIPSSWAYEDSRMYWAFWLPLASYGVFIVVVARTLLRSVFKLNQGRMLVYFS